MQKIGLISDTHGFIHPKLYDFFKDVDQIWHAGDIGSIDIADKLNEFKPLIAVHGNIDGNDIRITYKENAIFECEKVRVFMTHIGGYPNRYQKKALDQIKTLKPNLFISGHSHILKVIFDKKYELLHINPGAAGKSGIHQLITLIRFQIDKKDIKGLEILELRRG